jgi:predicted transcriptional regulator
MPLISIRLPDDVEAGLEQEAERLQRPKSEIARDAIVDYLQRQARERFLAEIARAARVRGDAEALEVAAEALPLDNEALELVEGSRVGEAKDRYRAGKRKKR